MYRAFRQWLLYALNIEVDYFIAFMVINTDTTDVKRLGNGSMTIRGGATADEIGNIRQTLAEREGIDPNTLFIQSFTRM